jgi:hypothetical protein
MFSRLFGRALACTLLFVCGCYSTSLLQDSRVLAPGRVRVAAGLGYQPPGATDGHAVVEAAVRVGVAPHVELQAKTSNLGSFGGALKVSVRDDASPLRISILGGVQGANVLLAGQGEAWWVTRNVLGINLTPVFGLRLNEDIELVLAPDLEAGFKKADSYHYDEDELDDISGPTVASRRDPWFGLGARLGVALHVSTHFTLLPECSLLVVAAGPPTRLGEYNRDTMAPTVDRVFTRGDLRGQCGMAVNIGSAYPD